MHSLLVLLVALETGAAAPQETLAENTVDTPLVVATQIPQLLQAIDSPRYEERRRAADKIEAWLGREELALTLSEAFQRALLEPELSFEVRWQLQRWCRRLPAMAIAPAKQALGPAEVDTLLGQLDDDSYAVRVGAARRWSWLIKKPAHAAVLLTRIKQRLLSPDTSEETRRRLEPAWQQARGAWLLAGPQEAKLAATDEAHFKRWIEQLAQKDGGERSQRWSEAKVAEIELLDALALDPQVPLVKRLIEDRLAQGGLDRDARMRLESIVQWTRPAMVAEYWQGHKHQGEQHLLVGVPSMAETAIRPSHFDRVDDRVAHCVSGNTLSPGDYPVGVAFPHPLDDAAFFHLVNLPTARQRMAYQYRVQRDPVVRLAEISRRTLDRVLTEKRALTEREIRMLAQLDYREVSRFAGRYFQQVDDEPSLAVQPDHFLGTASQHALICLLLAYKGTHEAAPGLLAALEKRRFLEPTSTPPYRLPWVAALAIASRDPWPGSDAWLAGLVARTDPIIEGQPDGPELGATAAALLLLRYQEFPARYQLRMLTAPMGQLTAVDTYRFAAGEGRRRVQQWWQEEGRHKAEKRRVTPDPAGDPDDQVADDSFWGKIRLEPIAKQPGQNQPWVWPSTERETLRAPAR